MFTFNVDLGQLIIAGLISIIGYLSTRAINRVYETLDKHDKLITELTIKLEVLIARNGRDFA